MIGFIGGIGSRASAGFAKKLVSLDLKRQFLLFNNPSDITFESLSSSVKVLVNAGCTSVAILCNTAHLYVGQLRDAFPQIHVIDMLALVAKYVVGKFGNEATIGLLTTKGVISSRVYHTAIELESKQQAKVVLPASEQSIDEINSCIYAIIGGGNAFGLNQQSVSCVEFIAQQIVQLKKENSSLNAVVLGCTDIADLLPSTKGLVPDEINVMVVDPLDVLAEHVLTL